MKIKMGKILLVVFAFLWVVAMAACGSDSDSGDDGSGDGNAVSQKSRNTVLYWDSSAKKFTGRASWTARTVEEQVLMTGFVDSVEWRIKAPDGFSEFTWGNMYSIRGTYSVDSASYTLTAKVEGDGEEFQTWAQIEGVKVTVRVNFTTGSYTDIATQDGYDYEVDVDSLRYYVDQFIQEPNGSVINTEFSLYYYGIDKAHKVKSAVAYVYEDDEHTTLKGTYTAECDWTDMEWLDEFACTNSVERAEFSATLDNSNVEPGRIKFVITFLGGETWDTGFYYWRVR